ncbi:MAG: hypothetical protein IH621_09075, partial [Krumholzibacteria bacterium]|nr:hypothetical protein [Candidatus Krumholzibacteria bacterium]
GGGLARFSAGRFDHFHQLNSGLVNDVVYAVAIEGEVDVPQVLFISSRDHLRFRDDTARRYRPGPLDVLRSAAVPARLRIVRTALPIPPVNTAGPEDQTPTPAEETTR